MEKRRYRQKSLLWALLPALLVFVLALTIILSGLNTTDRAVDSEGLRTARESIQRAAVTCYSVEGRYPDSWEYLRDHYGLAVDESRYAVHYEVFASNLMPSITVVRR